MRFCDNFKSDLTPVANPVVFPLHDDRGAHQITVVPCDSDGVPKTATGGTFGIEVQIADGLDFEAVGDGQGGDLTIDATDPVTVMFEAGVVAVKVVPDSVTTATHYIAHLRSGG